METVVMPKELTAENGAKALLIGEFSEKVNRRCPECGGENEWCDACSGSGIVTEHVLVQWDTIKSIYRMAVKHLSQPINAADEESNLCLCPLHYGDCEYCKNGECTSPLI